MFAIYPFLTAVVIGALLLGAIFLARRRDMLGRRVAVVLAIAVVLIAACATWFLPIPYIV